MLPTDDRTRRMRALREPVFAHDVRDWATGVGRWDAQVLPVLEAFSASTPGRRIERAGRW